MAVRGVSKGTPRLKGKTMMTMLPVWLSATFTECGCHVQLRITSNNAPSLTITVIHETLLDVIAHDIAGNDTIELEAQDSETLTIIVRNALSEAVACGVFQVSLALIEKLSAPLRPVLSSNLLVDQCAQGLVDSAVNRAMTALETEELAEVTQ